MQPKRSYFNLMTVLTVMAFVVFVWTYSVSQTQAQEEPTPLPPPPTSTPVPVLTEDSEAIRDEGVDVQNDLTDDENGPVNIFDISFVAGLFGTNSAAADINDDGKVDIFDISALAANYGKPEAEVGAASAIATPPPMPVVEAGEEGDDFGEVIIDVEQAESDVEVQAYYQWQPFKVGLGIDHVYTWDYFDGQTKTPPDFYAVASVGGSTARTAVVPNAFNIYPYWRLGWWRYQKYPKFNYYDPAGDAYYIPITLEIRDDDGRICYGYMGCRYAHDVADASGVRYERVKRLKFYPSSCKVVDDEGRITQGRYLSNNNNRCRVYLYTAGTEWPRAAVKYYIDGQWN